MSQPLTGSGLEMNDQTAKGLFAPELPLGLYGAFGNPGGRPRARAVTAPYGSDAPSPATAPCGSVR